MRFLTRPALFALIIFFLGTFSVTEAARVHLYDGVSVDKILKIIKEKAEIYNFTIRDKHYFTGESGTRYCDSYFCNSDKSRMVFVLGDKNTVHSALVIVHIDDAEKNDIMVAYGVSLNAIIEMTNLNNDERERLGIDMMTYMNKMMKEAEDNDEKVNFDKTFSIWSAKSKRYIDIYMFTDYSDDTMNFHIFAHT